MMGALERISIIEGQSACVNHIIRDAERMVDLLTIAEFAKRRARFILADDIVTSECIGTDGFIRWRQKVLFVLPS